MQRVGIKALKNNLSRDVRAAEAGETVLVTDRDRVLAELVPPSSVDPAQPKGILAQGIRKGWIRSPTNREPIEYPSGPPLVTLDQLLADLDGDREDR